VVASGKSRQEKDAANEQVGVVKSENLKEGAGRGSTWEKQEGLRRS
jgi:hypothetical protein